MSVHHPLAGRDVITLDDLADYPVASFHGVPKSSLHALAPAHAPSGRPIPRGPEVHDQLELINQLTLGEVVHAAVASIGRYSTDPEITERPLPGLPPAQSAPWSGTNRTGTPRSEPSPRSPPNNSPATGTATLDPEPFSRTG